MKKILVVTLILAGLVHVYGQDRPNWYDSNKRTLYYPTDSYITGYAIDNIKSGESQGSAITRIKDAARANAASTISVRIQNETQSTLYSYQRKIGSETIRANERTLNSNTKSTVDMELQNLNTDAYYDLANGMVAGFAYIKRSDLIRQLDRKISSKLSKIENTLDEADELVSNGEKLNAKKKIEKLPQLFAEVEDTQALLLAVDTESDMESIQLRETTSLYKRYATLRASLKNGINIYMSCNADLLGTPYGTLANKLNSGLSKMGCSFVSSPDGADWAIYINASVRKYNAFQQGAYTTYFVYVDADINIDKVVTNQRIYSNSISEKGGHTKDYENAARDAYKEITPKIEKILLDNIEK